MSNYILETVNLSKEELKDILNKIKNVRLGIIGDGCIDIYWDADMTLSELSRETPHYPLPVIGERISLGAAANVAINMKKIGAKFVTMVTLVGDDWRGEELKKLLRINDIDETNVVKSQTRITPAYCKPMRRGISDVVYEDPRLDFENRSRISPEDEARVLSQLEVMAGQVDIIAVSDQFDYGIVTEAVRKRLEGISLEGKIVVVDSRKRIDKYKDVIVKPNEVECIKAANKDGNLKSITSDRIYKSALKLGEKMRKPVVVTYGSKGSLWCEGGKITMAPSKPVEPPIDVVGAGDTFMSAFCCAYGGGTPGSKSIAFANIASSIVVKKIGTTGTASPEEIIERSGELND